MSVFNAVTDWLGITDSMKPVREAERQAQLQLQAADAGRIQANQIAQQAQQTQAQMAERARITEQVAAEAPKQQEADVRLDIPKEPAVRKRAKFQAQTDPSVSIRI